MFPDKFLCYLFRSQAEPTLCKKIRDCNGQTDLLIELLDRQPDPEWLICKTIFNYDGFEAKLKFSGILGDFGRFLNRLQIFYDTLKGEAQFNSIEDNVSFQFSTDGLGHVSINGYLRHSGYEVMTSFLIHSDQTFLPELLRELKEACSKVR
jgi:hypothetical protein